MNAIKFIQQHGVEKAREVVEGAPTLDCYFDPYDSSYMSQVHQYQWEMWKEDIKQWGVCEWDVDVSDYFLISDLNHLIESIFKLGDNVVWTVDMSDICDMNAIYQIKEHSQGQFKVFLKDRFICWVGDRVFDQEFRHATPQEIAAGHRIDLEELRDCDTSPNCKKYEVK